MAAVPCTTVGEALIRWLARATPAQQADLCEALAKCVGSNFTCPDLQGCAISQLENDAGYLTPDTVPPAPVTSVDGKTGRVETAQQTPPPDITSDNSALPTAVYGTRTALLATPTRWVQINGYLIPAYN